jgi:hypothetical protein
VLAEVADMLRASLTDPESVSRLRAEVEAQAKEEAGAGEAERRRIVARVEELTRLAGQGAERLLILPADLVPPAAAKLREWQQERERLAAELARLEAGVQANRQLAARVTGAMSEFQAVAESITTAAPDQVRDALAPLVKKVTLHFAHGEPLKGRGDRRRTKLASIEVGLQPEFAYLLDTGRSTLSSISRSSSSRPRGRGDPPRTA